MKKSILVAVFSFYSFISFSQKTIVDANAQLRTVSSFKAIKVSHGIDLFLSHGEEAVAVSAKDDETRDHIKTEVKDGILRIWYEWKDGKNLVLGNNKQLRAYVSYKTLEALGASGGADVVVDGAISSNRLTIDISGGADFKGKVNAQEIMVEASGGADVTIEGTVAKTKLVASGGSDIDAYGLQSEEAEAIASGGSDIHLTVTRALKANASGGSDIMYRGDANQIDKRSSGASDIRKS